MSVISRQIIETELDLRGTGMDDDPYRRVRQYWTPEGVLLAEVDPFAPTVESCLPPGWKLEGFFRTWHVVLPDGRRFGTYSRPDIAVRETLNQLLKEAKRPDVS